MLFLGCAHGGAWQPLGHYVRDVCGMDSQSRPSVSSQLDSPSFANLSSLECWNCRYELSMFCPFVTRQRQRAYDHASTLLLHVYLLLLCVKHLVNFTDIETSLSYTPSQFDIGSCTLSFCAVVHGWLCSHMTGPAGSVLDGQQ